MWHTKHSHSRRGAMPADVLHLPLPSVSSLITLLLISFLFCNLSCSVMRKRKLVLTTREGGPPSPPAAAVSILNNFARRFGSSPRYVVCLRVTLQVRWPCIVLREGNVFLYSGHVATEAAAPSSSLRRGAPPDSIEININIDIAI